MVICPCWSIRSIRASNCGFFTLPQRFSNRPDMLATSFSFINSSMAAFRSASRLATPCRIMSVNAKAGKAIGVALNDTACRVLKEQIGKHSRWVFVHTKEATRPDGTKTPSVRKMRCDDNTAWRIGLKRAGIEDFRFHDLRHTWASWLIQAGVPLSALQEMGGWESIEMVRRYAHLAPNHLTEHARKIDSLLGDNDTNTTQGGNQVGLKLA